MKRIIVTVKIFCVLLAVDSRKYDIESESIRLYGENLQSVLTRFRKSPEYLKILNEKVKQLYEYYNLALAQTWAYHDEKMRQEIGKMFKLGPKVDSTRRLFSDVQTFDLEQLSDPSEISSENLTVYTDLPLSLSERNNLKEIGFENVGRIIHDVIKSFNQNGTFVRSTLLPGGGNIDNKTLTSTTEHPEVHKVTSTDVDVTTITNEGPSSTHSTNFKYRAHKPETSMNDLN